jgi:hypothetical protein
LSSSSFTQWILCNLVAWGCQSLCNFAGHALSWCWLDTWSCSPCLPLRAGKELYNPINYLHHSDHFNESRYVVLFPCFSFVQ